MKIYVAGKFENKEAILEVHKRLEKMGHSISYNWTTHQNIKPYTTNQEMACTYAQNEIDGIFNSDCFIYFSAEKGHTLLMEFGAALMLAKVTSKPKIYAIGEFNNESPWFFNPLVTRKNNIEEVYKEIGENK